MIRPERALLGFSLLALVGVVVVVTAIGALLWRASMAAEESRVAELAETLGERVQGVLVDARETLEHLDRLSEPRCSPAHLTAMQDAALPRPYIRTIGHWRAAERLCGVGFISPSGLRPSRADRIYPSGLIAWWPGPETEVAGVRLFLLRFGDHDIAIDPTMLLETGPARGRQAALWLEGMRLAETEAESALPAPERLPFGLSIDRDSGRVLSRHARGSVYPIEIVAAEPIEEVWGRRLPELLALSVLGVVLLSAWVWLVARHARRHASPAAQLRHALSSGRILVRYQPVMDLRTGACVGAEALARWRGDDGEWISPEVFIPLAERCGLIGRITTTVLATLLRDLGPRLREDRRFSVSLNLASEDLLGEEFARALSAQLRQADVTEGRIKLEITERALIDSDASRRLIAELRGRGHAVLVDDFGTGYSSLSYLERMELDALKIDKSFVDGIGTAAVTVGVIGHIIEMADSLGLEVVAEGIEHAVQVEWLLGRGVRYGQGYHFGKALTVAEFDRFLAANCASVDAGAGSYDGADSGDAARHRAA